MPNPSHRRESLGQPFRGARKRSAKGRAIPPSRDARRRQRTPASAMSTVPEYNVHARKKENPKVYAVRAPRMPRLRSSRVVSPGMNSNDNTARRFCRKSDDRGGALPRCRPRNDTRRPRGASRLARHDGERETHELTPLVPVPVPRAVGALAISDDRPFSRSTPIRIRNAEPNHAFG